MSEKVVDIFCAQPIGDEEASDITIHIHTPVPHVDDVPDYIKAYRAMYMEQAEKLAKALCDSLPGGTIDALLVDLLDRKRSCFVIPSFAEEKGAKDNETKPSTG